MMQFLTPKGRSVFTRASLMALLLCLCALPLQAQTDTARIQGSVTDTTGAVVSGAQITVTNTDTNTTFAATSDNNGNFAVNALPRGNYKAEVKDAGFEGAVQTFALQISQVQALNFKLKAGGVSTEVTVTDAAPIVESASSSINEVIQGRQVTELPLNGRNFTALALLAPGVTRGNYGNSASGVNGDAETFRNQESGGGSLSNNGLRPQANNFILDGIDNNEALVNTLVFFPNIDGTQEFRVNTSTAPAEFGRAGGAIVQSSIKSGTNSIHGSAFEFARSSLFDANPNYAFLGASPAKALPFKRNEFGGSVGLPILRDKLFIFGDYQGFRQNRPLNAEIITVPTALMRTGNFSELLGLNIGGIANAAVTGCANYTLSNGTVLPNMPAPDGKGSIVNENANGAIFDPLTCAQFPGNIIPQDRLNKAAVNYLNAYPLPNIPGTNNGTESNYRTIRNEVTHYNTFDTRLDFTASPHDQLFARFAYDQSNFDRTSRLPMLPAGFASGANTVHARGIAVGDTHVFTANLLNEFRVGYNRYTFTNAPVFSGIPISANLGIVNANRTPQLGGGALIGGFNNELEYTGDYGKYAVPENTYQINDAISLSRGRHAFKFGASGIRRDVSFFRPIAGKGFFQIANGDFTGYQVSELLAGFIDNYSIGAQSGFFGTRNYEIGVFGQDDWKVSQRLTLNLGLRYDIFTYPTEEHNRQAALDPITGHINLAGVNGVPRSLINSDYKNFAPRFGFAYDAYGTGKTVLRGGYGIFYFLDRGGIDNQFGQQVPFGGSVTYNASKGYRIAFTGQAPLNDNNNADATNPLPLPGYPNFDPNNPPAGINVFATDRNRSTPSVQQYNLQVQQQFGAGTVFTLGYVANIGTHLSTGYNYNTTPLNAPPSQPNLFPNLGHVVYNRNNGVSHYNSLQTQLNHRVGQNLVLTTSYTWSHNLDNTDGFLGFFSVTALDFFDQRTNKGNSGLDQSNVFVASALYNLPFGRNQMFGSNWNRTLDLVAGGWQLNTIVQAETGTPFTVDYPQFGGGTSIRADSTYPIHVTHSTKGFYFDPTTFSHPPTGQNGNVARNFLHGPGLATGDVSLFKTLSLTERIKAELRAEAFNITNTPAFTNPDGNPNDGNFGRITGTREASERQLQMAVRFTF